MDQESKLIKDAEAVKLIETYVESSVGLTLDQVNDSKMSILQKADGRTIRFSKTQVEEVLKRQDTDGRDFLQVNFIDGKKILITEKLVGFKPVETKGLDIQKLPRVVTTPDLVSVIEAIEESMNSKTRVEEVDVLKKVFDSVLQGAEAVGFDLESERSWLNLITNIRHKASA